MKFFSYNQQACNQIADKDFPLSFSCIYLITTFLLRSFATVVFML